jgi:hypothetical protein
MLPDTARSSQVTLQHLSDSELVQVLSRLGNVYKFSRAEKATDVGLGCLQVLASVDRRFRSLVHNHVAQTLLLDSEEGYSLSEDCPSAADNLLRSCKEICISATAAAELHRNQRFIQLLSCKASNLTALSVHGGRIKRSQLQLFCDARWCNSMLSCTVLPCARE